MKCSYYPGVRIKGGSQENVPDTCFIDTKTKADVFTATKRVVTAISAN